jgi:hypothetical protein
MARGGRKEKENKKDNKHLFLGWQATPKGAGHKGRGYNTPRPSFLG